MSVLRCLGSWAFPFCRNLCLGADLALEKLLVWKEHDGPHQSFSSAIVAVGFTALHSSSTTADALRKDWGSALCKVPGQSFVLIFVPRLLLG